MCVTVTLLRVSYHAPQLMEIEPISNTNTAHKVAYNF